MAFSQSSRLESKKEHNFYEQSAALSTNASAGIVDIADEQKHIDFTDNGSDLHVAIKSNNLILLKKSISQGVKTYYTDKNFVTPLQLALETKNSEEFIEYLLEHRHQIDKNYIRNLLAYCLSYITDFTLIKDALLLDYVVSRLAGVNISKIITPTKLATYLTHLKDMDLGLREEKPKDGKKEAEFISLEGWEENEFLILRIRALFQMALQVQLYPDSVVPFNLTPEITLDFLLNEMIVSLETLQIHQSIQAALHQSDKKKQNEQKFKPQRVEAIVKNLVLSIRGGVNCVIPSGWRHHAIYITLANDKATDDVFVRIDNLGDGCKKYHKKCKDNDSKIYPLFSKMNYSKIFHYIKSILKCNKSLERKQSLQFIYNQELLEQQLECPVGIPAFQKQMAGTCVVTNFNVGMRLRAKNEKLYTWVCNQEFIFWSAMQSRSSEIKTLDASNFPQIKSLPTYTLSNIRKKQLMSHIVSTKKEISLLFGNKKISINKYEVELVLKPENRKLEKKKETEEEMKSSAPSQDSGSKVTHFAPEPYERKMPSSDLIKLMNNEAKAHNHAVIFGHVGMGKSTLCQRFVFLWAVGEQCLSSFDFVFNIPLRNLIRSRYPLEQFYTLADIVIKECFPENSIQKDEIFLLKNTLKKSKVLWLVDGIDELPNIDKVFFEKIWHELLAVKYLIITSRHHNFTQINFLKETCYLEILGFDEKTIHTYMHDFFLSSAPRVGLDDEMCITDKIDKLKNLLKETAKVMAVPIQLTLVCSIWQDNPRILSNAGPLTLSRLYYLVTLWLMRRFLKSESLDDVKLDNEQRLFRRLSDEIHLLEEIAYHMTDSVMLEISYVDFQKKLPKISDADLLRDLLAIGVLLSVNSERISDFQFIHKSFQEFFAARYLVSNFDLGKVHACRYFFQYKMVLVFMVGILASQKRNDQLEQFFEALLAEPRELKGHYELMLLMRCMNELLAYDVLNDHKSYLSLLLAKVVKAIGDYLLNRFESRNYSRYELNKDPVLNEFRECSLLFDRVIKTLQDGKISDDRYMDFLAEIKYLNDEILVYAEKILAEAVEKITNESIFIPKVFEFIVDLKIKSEKIKDILFNVLRNKNIIYYDRYDSSHCQAFNAILKLDYGENLKQDSFCDEFVKDFMEYIDDMPRCPPASNAALLLRNLYPDKEEVNHFVEVHQDNDNISDYESEDAEEKTRNVLEEKIKYLRKNNHSFSQAVQEVCGFSVEEAKEKIIAAPVKRIFGHVIRAEFSFLLFDNKLDVIHTYYPREACEYYLEFLDDIKEVSNRLGIFKSILKMDFYFVFQYYLNKPCSDVLLNEILEYMDCNSLIITMDDKRIEFHNAYPVISFSYLNKDENRLLFILWNTSTKRKVCDVYSLSGEFSSDIMLVTPKKDCKSDQQARFSLTSTQNFFKRYAKPGFAGLIVGAVSYGAFTFFRSRIAAAVASGATATALAYSCSIPKENKQSHTL